MNPLKKWMGNAVSEDSVFTAVLETLLDGLYPRRCPICETILSGEHVLICDACERHLPLIREPLCKHCGRPLEHAEDELCFSCRVTDHAYQEGRAAFLYEGALRESVMRMKFHNQRYYLDFYAQAMAKYLSGYLNRIRPDRIVPVPMHERKVRERGFDQCAILADRLSGRTGIPACHHMVKRARYTKAQKGLNLQERMENLEGAFEVIGAVPDRILLLDDIYTTGSTIDALARALQDAGCSHVYFLTLCIVKGQEAV